MLAFSDVIETLRLPGATAVHKFDYLVYDWYVIGILQLIQFLVILFFIISCLSTVSEALPCAF